jgi:hypothetical protein
VVPLPANPQQAYGCSPDRTKAKIMTGLHRVDILLPTVKDVIATDIIAMIA